MSWPAIETASCTPKSAVNFPFRWTGNNMPMPSSHFWLPPSFPYPTSPVGSVSPARGSTPTTDFPRNGATGSMPSPHPLGIGEAVADVGKCPSSACAVPPRFFQDLPGRFCLCLDAYQTHRGLVQASTGFRRQNVSASRRDGPTRRTKHPSNSRFCVRSNGFQGFVLQSSILRRSQPSVWQTARTRKRQKR